MKKEWKVLLSIHPENLQQELNTLAGNGYEVKDTHRDTRGLITIVAYIWRKK